MHQEESYLGLNQDFDNCILRAQIIRLNKWFEINPPTLFILGGGQQKLLFHEKPKKYSLHLLLSLPIPKSFKESNRLEKPLGIDT